MSSELVSKSSNSPLFWTLVTFVVPSLAALPMLLIQWRRLLDQSHMQFFPLAVGLSAWLLYKEPFAPPQTPARRTFAILASIAALLVTVACIFLYSFGGIQFSLFCLVMAWGSGVYGRTKLTRLFAIGTLLLVTIPLPGGGDKRLIQYLQGNSTVCSSYVLDGLGITHVVDGNIIRLPERHLFVEEACSGIDSLYALVAVGLSVIVLLRRPIFSAVVTMLFVVMWAFAGNLIRISIISIVLTWCNVDLSSGWAHSVLGMVIFTLVCGMLVLTDQGLNAIFTLPKREIASDPYPVGVVSHTSCSPSHLSYLRVGWVTSVLACGSLLLASISLMALLRAGETFLRTKSMNQFAADSLPGEAFFSNKLPGIKEIRFQSETRDDISLFGKYSHTWNLSSVERQFLVSLDFPFYDWHELSVCYTSAGWTILNRTSSLSSFRDGSPAFIHSFDLRNAYGVCSHVDFVLFSQTGISVSGPEAIGLIKSRNVFRQAGLVNSDELFDEGKALYQVQLVAEHESQLSDNEAEKSRALLISIADPLRRAIVNLYEPE